MSRWHWKWGHNKQEQAAMMDMVSEMCFRRSSCVSHDRLHVSANEREFLLTLGRKTTTYQKRQDAEKAIQAHYMAVRERLSEGCHY